ncbi:hypothetical protein Syun_026573 [Stephania yunnanensis]|uniref:Uncharacterized protein n=1 Tax=Stephania yunnanensis TaxID=152371 RepID=A0AAP0EZB6_9MAGN
MLGFALNTLGSLVIDTDDIKLAIQTKANFSFSQPPPLESYVCAAILNLVDLINELFEVLLELASNRNKISHFWKSVAGPGISLPPEEDTLIGPNYQLALPKRPHQAIEETRRR